MVSPRPVNRRRLAGWMVGLYLMVQWLVAAHACGPTLAFEPSPPAAHAGCEGLDATPDADEDGALCQAHCHPVGQASADAQGIDLPQPTPGWYMVAVAPPGLPGLASPAARAVPRSGAPPGWPPLYLVHRVLRN